MTPDYPFTRWRLLLNPDPAPGAWNMAVDEAVFESIENENALPTLHLYAWEPACLSLGQLQPIAEADLGALSARGWDVVRRLTGGRAILHGSEITYSVIGPRNDPRLSGRVLDSYQRIACGLLRALEILSVDCCIHQEINSNGKSSSPVCFEVPSIYEITIDGKKIIGSAQARRRNALLQHGSLPLGGDLMDITRVMVFPGEAERVASARQLMEHAANMLSALGREVSWDQAAIAMVKGFEEALNLELIPGELSPHEHAVAERLCREKYSTREWTQRF